MSKHPREKLTPLFLKRAGPGRHADGEGLYMLVDATGGRRWLLRTMIRGKRCDLGLGTVRYGDGELKKVRGLARELRDAARQGRDPLAERRAERAKQLALEASVKTFREVAEEYIDTKRPEWTNPKHAAQWSSTLNIAYDAFGDVPIQLVETAHILAALKPIWNLKPETASRLRGRIAAVLDAAKARKLRTGDNPADWRGALQASLPANQAKSRLKHHPALPYVDLAAFMIALKAQQGIAAQALEFTILTAARTAETIGAKWEELDVNDRVWNVPPDRMKAGKGHRVPLSSRAVALIESLPRVGNFIFANKLGENEPKPLSNMAMLALLKRMGREDITVHGFRSTFRDWAGEQTMYPREVIEHALAHQLADAAEAAYQRGDLLRRRRALMADWSTYCGLQCPGMVA